MILINIIDKVMVVVVKESIKLRVNHCKDSKRRLKVYVKANEEVIKKNPVLMDELRKYKR